MVVPEKCTVNSDGSNVNVSLENVVCNLCGCNKSKFFALTRDLYSDTLYTIVKCKHCNLIYVNPRRSDYEEKYADSMIALPYFLEKMQSEQSAFNFPIDLILRYKQKGIVLDVGTGIGHFLLEMRRRDFEVHGV